ncbi:MAG TPA: D-glycero-beta-D-manno-heptose 1-phosphate adenylyltransferase [Mycobacteriales bacterium]|nr:D-glycero-beta-D-manno-heptose 1-phosphate adenylyltransferase [Mycobacteriales bacterium]
MRGPLVVVGDAFLDRDVVGTSDRLCPDAPVPVVDVRAQVHRPGGAALAALIAAVDGHDVVLVTALGDDDAGARVRALLAGRVRVVGVPLDGPTPEKIRVRVAGRSLVRLDRGGAPAPVGTPGADALATIAGAGAVLVSDYGRGVTAEPAIRRALSAVAARRPVVWDPHPRGREPVPGVRLVTPNAREAAALSGLPGDGLPGVTAAADHLRGRWEATAVAVTLGPRGALLMLGEREPLVVPAPVLGEAVDTCGAGDAFAAAAASALAAGEVLSEAVAGAVRRASAFVAAGGAAAVGPGTGPAAVPHRGGTAADVVARVRAAGGTVVATGGCFDLLHPGHVATLQAARGLGDCLIVCMNSDASVRRLKGPDRPICPEEDRARVLAAFSAVDAVVVFDEDTPERVLAELRPDIWVKGGDYAGVHVPEADLVRGWGGQAVVVPYLDGRSSTRLVAAARGTIR